MIECELQQTPFLCCTRDYIFSHVATDDNCVHCSIVARCEKELPFVRQRAQTNHWVFVFLQIYSRHSLLIVNTCLENSHGEGVLMVE